MYYQHMRVLIDCTQIGVKKAGVGIYALNLVQGICNSCPDGLELFLLVQDDDNDFQFIRGAHVIRISSKWFRLLPFRFLMEQVYIPWLARKHKIDVLHSLHYSFPLLPTRARKVVTVHDMTFFLMPDVHLKTKVIYFRFFIAASSSLADALIFVSDSTKADWKKRYPCSTVPGYTVPLGKSSAFHANIDQECVSTTLRKYRLTRPYVLYIGTIEPRKNLVRLVQAFAQVSDKIPSYSLVISGMMGWGYSEVFDVVRQLNLESRVVFTGFIGEEDKPPLLSGAAAFVYASLYEGFGIPVLEALACGTPTLTSDTSSLPEVAGDAALLADPDDTADIARELERLLFDEHLRTSLRRKGIQQAENFSWERTVHATLSVYDALVPCAANASGNRSELR
jgi:glycosyltransferase involved in cell wall biosynthesis